MKLSLFLTCALFTFSLLGAENLPTPGDEVDLAPFGHMRTWDGNPGVEWDESRDVRRIEVDFVDEREIPSADSLHLEYWVSQWPPVLRGGWTPTDDPWQGEWRAVMASREVRRKTLVYRFLPLTEEENPNARNVPDFRPTFRRMLKFRVRFVGRPGTKTGFRVYGSSRWNMREINVQTGCEGRPGFEAGVTAYNGIIIGSTPLQAEPRGLRFKVLYTEHAPSSHDRTILTIRGGSYAFGVSVNDVIRRKAVYVMPLGVFVGDAAVGENFASWQASGNFRAAEDVISRIARQPEQTLDRAMGEIPALAFTARSGRHPYRYIPLGFPSSREKYGLDFNGNIFINKRSVKAMKEDLGRMLWKGDEIYFRLGTGSVPDFRERELAARQTLLEEYLPIVTTTWQNGEVEYTEEVYVTMLDAPLDDARLRGDEPTLLYMKLSARNPASRPAEAQVWLHVSPAERLELSKGMLLGTGNESGPYARARLRVALEAEAETLELHDLPPAASHTGKAVTLDGLDTGSGIPGSSTSRFRFERWKPPWTRTGCEMPGFRCASRRLSATGRRLRRKA